MSALKAVKTQMMEVHVDDFNRLLAIAERVSLLSTFATISVSGRANSALFERALCSIKDDCAEMVSVLDSL